MPSEVISFVSDPVMGTTKIPAELVPKYWAKKVWTAGIRNSYFNKFMGSSSGSIIQIYEDLSKKKRRQSKNTASLAAYWRRAYW